MVCTGLSDVFGSWKIMAIADPRSVRSPRGCKPTSPRPRYLTDPDTVALPGRSPSTASIVTVLPEPDSPTTPRTFCGSSVRSTPRTADTGPSGVGNVTSRPVISRTGAIDVERTPAYVAGIGGITGAPWGATS